VNDYLKALQEECDRFDNFHKEMGDLIGYIDKPCVNCGRYRVEKFSTGIEVCEKCGVDQRTKEGYINKYGRAVEFYF